MVVTSPLLLSLVVRLKSIVTEGAWVAFLLKSDSTCSASGSFWADRVRVNRESKRITVLVLISDYIFIEPLQNLFQSLRILHNHIAGLAAFERSDDAGRFELVYDPSRTVVSKLHTSLYQ
jgi:hypothetical protein